MTTRQLVALAFAEELVNDLDNFLYFRDLLERPPRRIALTAEQLTSLDVIEAVTWTDGPDGPRCFYRGFRLVEQGARV